MIFVCSELILQNIKIFYKQKMWFFSSFQLSDDPTISISGKIDKFVHHLMTIGVLLKFLYSHPNYQPGIGFHI